MKIEDFFATSPMKIWILSKRVSISFLVYFSNQKLYDKEQRGPDLFLSYRINKLFKHFYPIIILFNNVSEMISGYNY